jgi:hypothetical protein
VVDPESPPVPPVTGPEPEEPENESSEKTTSTTSTSSSTSSSSSSSSSSAAPTLVQCLIVPNYDAAPAVWNAFTEVLKEQTDPKTLLTGGVQGPPQYVSYWIQNLNDTQVLTFKTNPAVGGILPYKPADTEVFTRDVTGKKIGRSGYQYHRYAAIQSDWDNDTLVAQAPRDSSHGLSKRVLYNMETDLDDLKVYSQPPNIKLADITTYTHEIEPIGAARIYIVDSGANKDSYVSQQGWSFCSHHTNSFPKVYKSLKPEPDCKL